MTWREADTLGCRRANRLLEPDRQPILIASRDQADARWGANGGVRVGLREAQPLGRELVDVGGRVVALAMAADIGKA